MYKKHVLAKLHSYKSNDRQKCDTVWLVHSDIATNWADHEWGKGWKFTEFTSIIKLSLKCCCAKSTHSRIMECVCDNNVRQIVIMLSNVCNVPDLMAYDHVYVHDWYDRKYDSQLL